MMAASSIMAPWRSLPPTRPCSRNCAASAWRRINDRRRRHHRNHQPAEAEDRLAAGRPGAAADADRPAAGRQFLDLGDADRGGARHGHDDLPDRSEEHTSELQSLMRISYAVFCLKKKKNTHTYIQK